MTSSNTVPESAKAPDGLNEADAVPQDLDAPKVHAVVTLAAPVSLSTPMRTSPPPVPVPLLAKLVWPPPEATLRASPLAATAAITSSLLALTTVALGAVLVPLLPAVELTGAAW